MSASFRRCERSWQRWFSSFAFATLPSVHVDEILRRLPKTELHLHLEGAVSASTFAELAAKHGVELPIGDPDALYAYDTLGEFLGVYSLVSASIRTIDDFARITYECLQRCAHSGARYVEFFFSAESHLEFIDYPQMLEGVLQGMDDAATDFDLPSQVIPAINRELGASRAVEFVELVQANRADRVVGVGLDFNEVGFPPENYIAAFDLARSYGLHRTSHAGEVGPAANVRNGIELLRCERVDHGYNIVDDPALVAECVESRIPFTVCPTTTTFTTDHRDLTNPQHPIRRMADAGMCLTINSDDPTMFRSELSDEYVKAHHQLGFTLAEIRACAINGIDAAWVDDSTKSAWRAEWVGEIDRLLASVTDES